ncbi:MAG: prolyl oligopeptidase family serine peptidase [Limisphaerales bacterium]
MLRGLLSLLFVGFAAADAAQRTHDITIDDYFTQAYIAECVASPDGTKAAFIELRWVGKGKDDGRESELWVVDIKSGKSRRLTFEKGSKSSPQWSPDSQSIYFAGGFKREAEKKPPYDGSGQVWRINTDGTDFKPITRIPKGMSAFQLASDASAIHYTVHKEHVIDDWKSLRSEFKADLKFGHGIHKISELYRLDLNSWRTEKLVAEKRYINSFDVAPQGNRIAMLTIEDELLINNEGKSRVDILDVKTKKITTLPDKLWRADAPSPYGWLESPAWSPDGNLLAFMVAFDGYPSEMFLARRAKSRYHVSKLPRPTNAYVSGALQWRPNSRSLCFNADRRARHSIFSVTISADGKRPVAELTPGKDSVGAFSFSRDGKRLVVEQAGRDYSSDIFHGAPGSKTFKRLTRLNPQVDTWKLPKQSVVKWKAPDGKTVEGILQLPPDHDDKKKLPLIVQLHGGPTGSTPDVFRYWIYGMTIHAANGYAVLSPNYRGSTGYGDKFLTDLIGRENDIEVKDILAGIDHLIKRGLVDPKRMGVTGWSNGGYLSNCLIATGRFKAASTGAGVFDMTIQWGEEDTPGHVINYLKGLPWEVPAEYQRASPLYHLKPGNKTATLIHVGENDPRCPITHSRALHRAMKYYLNAPCELLIYPGAGHGLTKYRHRLAKLKWDVAWFQKYLK